jgi:sigma-B regulation protein RsbU (phosphoserine phosphatase)
MFVTVLYGVLDRRTREFTYCRAGHTLPLVLDSHGISQPLPSGIGHLLGVVDDIQLDQQIVILPEGGLLVLLTDGVPDALDQQGEAFGSDRLQTACLLHPDDTAQSVCERVQTAVRNHRA